MMIGGRGRRSGSSSSGDILAAVSILALFAALPFAAGWLVLKSAGWLLRAFRTRAKPVHVPAIPEPADKRLLASGRLSLLFAIAAAPIAICAILYAAFAPIALPPAHQQATVVATAAFVESSASDETTIPQATADNRLPESSLVALADPPEVSEQVSEVSGEAVKATLEPTRQWADVSGRFHTDASLADVQFDKAYLKEANGRIVAVPFDRLSSSDRDYVRSKSANRTRIAGKVIGITDGDTLTVVDDAHKQHKIRLEGIDAPETHQAYGNEARKALSAKVFGKEVTVESHGLDKYGRTLGHVFADGRWINNDLVKEGWAWHYRRFSKSAVLADSESIARTSRAGLWNSESAMAPWDFRDSQSTSSKAPGTGKILLKGSDSANIPRSKSSKTSTPKSEPSSSGYVDRNPNGETVTGHTATGIPTFTGPRGGHYHYSKSGNKVYERKKK